MLRKNLEKIDPIEADEGTKIRQIFHPHNTLSGIRYSLAQSIISVGHRSRLHRMKTSEVYYILEGQGIMYVDDESIPISKNQAVYVKPMSKQFVENTGTDNLEFLCIVDPAWKQEDEILLD